MGFLTGFATGVFKQADENYDNVANYQAQLMKQRQQLVDRVQQQQAEMDKKTQDIIDRQNSYMQTYNIPKDQAYALATNPTFYKMTDTDKQQSFVANMKPTGKYTQPQSAQFGLADKGMQKDFGAFGGGKINIPAVPGVVHPAQPSRQIYSVDAGPERYEQVRKIFGNITQDQLTPDGIAAFNRANTAIAAGQQPTPDDVTTVMTSAHKKSLIDTAAKTTTQLVAQGIVDPKDAPAVQAGLASGNVDYNLIGKKAGKDPVFQEKVAELEKIGVPHAMAEKLVMGLIKPIRNLQGQDIVTDLTTMQPIKYGGGAANTPAIGNPVQQNTGNPSSPQQSSVTPNNQVADSSGTATPTPKPAPTPVNSAGGSLVPELPPPNPSPMFDKKNYSEAMTTLRTAPIALSKVNYMLGLLQKDPSAVGLWGEAIKHIGGPMVAITNLVGQNAGNAVDNWLGVSQNKQFHAGMADLQASLTRPILSDVTGKISNFEREQVADLLNSDHWSDTPQGTQKALQYVKQLFQKSVAANLDAMYPAPNDLPTNTQAQAARFQFLTRNMKLSKQDAYGVLHQEIGIKQGQGLQ